MHNIYYLNISLLAKITLEFVFLILYFTLIRLLASGICIHTGIFGRWKDTIKNKITKSLKQMKELKTKKTCFTHLSSCRNYALCSKGKTNIVRLCRGKKRCLRRTKKMLSPSTKWLCRGGRRFNPLKNKCQSLRKCKFNYRFNEKIN